MSKKSDEVKRGYASLDSTERAEVRKWIEEFERATYDQKRSINETFNKSLGPKSENGCACCGK